MEIVDALGVISSGLSDLLCTSGHVLSDLRHVSELIAHGVHLHIDSSHAATRISTRLFFDQGVPGTRRKEQEIFRSVPWRRITASGCGVAICNREFIAGARMEVWGGPLE